jgi:hypothetical protein
MDGMNIFIVRGALQLLKIYEVMMNLIVDKYMNICTYGIDLTPFCCYKYVYECF